MWVDGTLSARFLFHCFSAACAFTPASLYLTVEYVKEYNDLDNEITRQLTDKLEAEVGASLHAPVLMSGFFLM